MMFVRVFEKVCLENNDEEARESGRRTCWIVKCKFMRLLGNKNNRRMSCQNRDVRMGLSGETQALVSWRLFFQLRLRVRVVERGPSPRSDSVDQRFVSKHNVWNRYWSDRFYLDRATWRRHVPRRLFRQQQRLQNLHPSLGASSTQVRESKFHYHNLLSDKVATIQSFIILPLVNHFAGVVFPFFQTLRQTKHLSLNQKLTPS